MNKTDDFVDDLNDLLEAVKKYEYEIHYGERNDCKTACDRMNKLHDKFLIKWAPKDEVNE